MSIDLDLYSSTVHALRVLDADQSLLLPRIHCYLDDITGLTCGDYNGERLAVSDFNASHEMRKISPIYRLRLLTSQVPRQAMDGVFLHGAHL